MRAGVLQVIDEERPVPRSLLGAEDVGVDAGWIERLRAEADGAVRHRGPCRHEAADSVFAEADDVARFGHGHVDGEDRGVGHAVQREDRTVEIGDGDDHAGVAVERQADGGARASRRLDAALHDALHVGQRQSAGAGAWGDEIFIRGAASVERAEGEDRRKVGQRRGGGETVERDAVRDACIVEAQPDVRTEEREPDAVDEYVAGSRQRIERNRHDAGS